MPRKKKPEFHFPPEVLAVWHAAPNLTLCPKYRHRGFDEVLAHIKKDNCERCRAVYRQLNKECALIDILMRSRN